jgi:hypothetical protein
MSAIVLDTDVASNIIKGKLDPQMGARLVGHDLAITFDETQATAQSAKRPLNGAIRAGGGPDRGGRYFLPWFLTASMDSAAAAGSRYSPPAVSGLKSASSS